MTGGLRKPGKHWTAPTTTPKLQHPEAEEQLPPPGHKLWFLKKRMSWGGAGKLASRQAL